MSAVFDTNVWVSAFQFGGRAAELVQLAKDGEIEVFLSQAILDETLRVLREKFEWQPYEIHALRHRLLKTCKLVEPTVRLSVLGDEPDNRILECAQEAASQFIITEDKAMLRLKEHAGAKIVRVSEFIAAGRER